MPMSDEQQLVRRARAYVTGWDEMAAKYPPPETKQKSATYLRQMILDLADALDMRID